MKKMTGMKPLLLTFCAVGVLSAMNQTWAADVVTNCAQVSKANEQDVNSTPSNKTEAELLAGFNAIPKTLENDESCAPVTIEATPTYSIGNRVWIDTDNSGDATTGEVGAGAGVKLILKNGAGTQVGSPTETDADGRYLFSGLAAGNYQVCILAENFEAGGKLEGYLPSTGSKQTADPNNIVDGLDNGEDTVGGIICASAIALGDNEPEDELGFTGITDGDDGQGTPDNRSNLTVDFGVTLPPPPTVSVGDTIWEDVDGDGKQGGATDKPLADVTVTLKKADGSTAKDINDADVLPQQTDVNGNYQFVNLPEGDYLIEVTKPAGYDFTKANEGTDGKIDSNCAVTDGKTAAFALGVGAEINDGDDNANNDPTQDCGLVKLPTPTVSVGDTIWEDVDGDGKQGGATDKPLADVTVTLKKADGTTAKDINDAAVLPQKTDVNGNYQFVNLPEGDYLIEVTKPAGYDFTKANEGTDGKIDSNCAVTDGKTAAFALGVGAEINDGDDNANNDPTQDCGLVKLPTPTVSVGDTIWEDVDGDGKQGGATDKPLADVTVTLKKADGTTAKDINDAAVLPQKTDVNGNYQFVNLPEGDYLIEVTKPAGYDFTKANEGTDSKIDSNCVVTDGKTAPFALGVGAEINDGDDNANNDPTQDCGLVKLPTPTVSVGDTIWEDVDGDGKQGGATDKPLADVTVTLKKADGTIAKDINDAAVLPQKTDVNGNYQFVNLPEGDYLIEVTKPAGYDFTKANEGTDTKIDSNCAVTDGKISGIALTVGAEINDGDDNANNDPTQDCGLVKLPTPTVSVGDTIWEDVDGDGKQGGATDKPLADVTVTLKKADGSTAKDINDAAVLPQKTDVNGNYQFVNLPEGDYLIEVTKPAGYDFTKANEGTDSKIDSNCAVTDGKTAPFALGVGAEINDGDDNANNDPTQDCGLVKLPTPTVSVGDTIWEDVDGDGKQGGATDKPLADVTVTLKKADGTTAKDINDAAVLPQKTDVNGNYQFVNLPEGDYLIEVTKPAGYDFTKVNEGTDSKIDSNCAVTDGKTAPFALGVGAEINDGDDNANNDPTQDCGLVKQIVPPTPVSVGNYIWEDTDKDGIQDAAEKGIAGVTVTLTDKNGNPVKDLNDVTVVSQPTDVDGFYQFDNLPAGEYQIVVSKPTGYDFAKPMEGTDTKVDSNCAVTDGKISGIVLAAGAEIDDGDTNADNDPTQDCGLAPTVAPTYSIGNRVWIDTNNSGDANTGEVGVALGIKLILKDDGGTIVDETETDASGRYLFSGLDAGSYQVCLLAENFAAAGKLAGYLPSTGANQKENPDIGGDDNRGIDGDDNGDDDVTGDICANLTELNDQEPLKEFGFTDNNDGDDGKSTPDNRSNLSIDFGVVPPPKKTVNVGDYIWIDTDKDGLQDPEELPLKGAEVTLLNKDGSPVVIDGGVAIPSQTTDEDGKYLFTGLPEGEYTIKVQAEGYTLTKSGGDVDANASNTDSNCEADLGGTAPFSLMAGQEPEVDGDGANGNLTIDCGMYPTPTPVVKHSLGNKVWIDDGNGTAANANNGQMDAGEKPVVDGVRMELWNTAEPPQNIASLTTVNGFYVFDNLEAGDYRVCIASGNFAATGLLANYTASTGGNELDPNEDVDKNDNGDDDLQYGICNTKVITLGAGEPTAEADTASGNPGDDGKGTADNRSNLTLDFGVLPPPAAPETVGVGDKMWVDLDGNGKQDPGDPGLGGVTVKLLDKDGKLVATQVTKPDGSYFFDKLTEGDYRIVAIPPSLYNIVTKNAGDVDDKPFNDDSNCAADGSTALFTLKAGAEPTDDGDTDANTNRSVDCGFVPHVQIPTVSEWGLAIMSMLLATVAFFRRRRED